MNKERLGSNNYPVSELPSKASEQIKELLIEKAMDKNYIIRNEQKLVLGSEYVAKVTPKNYLTSWEWIVN